jgi:exopolyphosphatase/guanosine-5'-triphosphate,3'-diphosphate pyrophosphatase
VSESVTIGAVDAGTNAVRVVIARADGHGNLTRLHKERWPVRLGHQVFTRKRFSPRTLKQAVEAFRHFRELFNRFEVQAYRTVATSATRESANRQTLIERIRREADIRLDVISGEEEARLTRIAVQDAVCEEVEPQVIVDIGGGSLEIITLDGPQVVDSVSLPIGTVRLMETFGIAGSIDDGEAEMLRRYVRTLLEDYFGDWPMSQRVSVGCGGNVEALADIVGGPKCHGHLALHIERFSEYLPAILGQDIHQRMAAYQVRRDRAEVMGIAGIVLATVGEFMEVSALLAPDVGVREGLLLELAACSGAGDGQLSAERRRVSLVDACRTFARGFQEDQIHSDYVRRLSVSIFDQLADYHGLGAEHRLALELGAILHDIGYAVSRRQHHKHGEYVVKNAQIQGLDGDLADLVAALVRHHNKSFPAQRHETFSSLSKANKAALQKLAGILRIADGLDAHFRQTVESVQVRVDQGRAAFHLSQQAPSQLPALGAKQKGHLFEVAFELEPVFE